MVTVNWVTHTRTPAWGTVVRHAVLVLVWTRTAAFSNIVLCLFWVWGSVVSTRTVSGGGVEVENDNTYLRSLYQDSSVVNRMPCSVVSCVNSYSNVLQGGTVSVGVVGAENDMILLTDMIKTSIRRIYRYVIMSTENMGSKYSLISEPQWQFCCIAIGFMAWIWVIISIRKLADTVIHSYLIMLSILIKWVPMLLVLLSWKYLLHKRNVTSRKVFKLILVL